MTFSFLFVCFIVIAHSTMLGFCLAGLVQAIRSLLTTEDDGSPVFFILFLSLLIGALTQSLAIITA